MAGRLLEELNGVGEVKVGDTALRAVRYRLEVWGEGTHDGQLAHPVIEGHIDLTGIGEAVVLAGPDSLTLTLEDGRRLLFSVADTGGKIVGRGILEAA